MNMRLVILSLCLTASLRASAQERNCGPRCVRFLLHQFGRSVDLRALIDELHVPDNQNGCSLQTIKDSLERYGAVVRVMSVANLRNFSGPAFLLLHRPGTTPESAGHFICGWRTGDRHWHQFDPPENSEEVRFSTLMSGCSETGLLVANSETDLQSCRAVVAQYPWLTAKAIAIPMAIVAIVFVMFQTGWRRAFARWPFLRSA